jgi:hypothetical protein
MEEILIKQPPPSNLTGIDSAFSGNRKRVKTFKMKHLFNPFSIPDYESIYFPSPKTNQATPGSYRSDLIDF